MLAELLLPWVNAFPTAIKPTPSPLPIDIWLTYWQPIILFVVQVASLIFLIIYVVKTANIAKSNRDSAKAMADSLALTATIATANSEAAQATKDTANATIISVELSRNVLKEMQEARQLQTAPYVIVYFEIYGGTIFNLVMENLGQSVAEDVTLSFDPPLQIEHIIGDTLPAFITETTANLAPRQKMNRWLFNSLGTLKKPEIPKKYEVTVSYRGGIQDRAYIHTFKLDMESFLGTNAFDEPLVKALNDGLKQVADAEKEIAKAIGEIRNVLDYKLTPLAAQSYQSNEWLDGNLAEHFKALVKGLASDWRSWQAHKDPGDLLPSWTIEQRFSLSIQAMVAIAPYLSVSEAQLDRIRSLMFDLQRDSGKLRYRSEETNKQITGHTRSCLTNYPRLCILDHRTVW